MNFGFRLLFLLALIGKQSFSQSYIYNHYTRNNGLAGNTVYCSAQDKDGFLWFGTENGASRFDGKNFVNFTTNDGLTDNEVLEMFSDSSGRTWFVCFTGSLCYYYKGKIYNYRNDPLLPQSFIPSKVLYKGAYEDPLGTIWLTSEALFRYNPDTTKIVPLPKIYARDAIGFLQPEKGKATADLLIFKFPDATISRLVLLLNGSYRHTELNDEEFRKNSASKKFLVIPENPGRFFYKEKNAVSLFSIQGNRVKHLKKAEFNYSINKVYYYSLHNEIWLSSIDSGAIRLNDSLQVVERHLENEKVSSTTIDQYGNCWHTTLGNGVFLFHKSGIKNLTKEDGLHSNEIVSLSKISPNELVLGFTKGYVQHIIDGKTQPAKQVSTKKEYSNDVRAVLRNSKKELFYLTEKEVIKETSSQKYFNGSVNWAAKDIALIRDSILVLADFYNVFLIYPSGRQDTIVHSIRTTSLLSNPVNEIQYIATIDTLYRFTYGDRCRPVPLYNTAKYGKVSDMCYSGNILYISTYNSGIVCIYNNSVKSITEVDGLISNQCRKLFLENDSVIWVTSNMGISRLSLDSGCRLAGLYNYSVADGFSSDCITGICKISDTIWVSTNNGLNFFTENQISSAPDHAVKITSFYINDSTVSFFEKNIVAQKGEMIRIGFNGISISSADKLIYKYQLLPSGNQWIKTSSGEIELPNLPAGKYRFTVFAIDKNNRPSKSAASIAFEVLPPFWETWWFRIIILSFILFAALMGIRYRIRKIKSAAIEKTTINKQFAELKLEAVRAQMNPHFIFNCLNAIQHFNIKENYNTAQYFMAEFAKLIRKTLNHSHTDFIVLAEEIELLESYIKLEQLRFEDLINYTIDISDDIRQVIHQILVPSLIFQPYVENAINHGLKYLKTGRGKLNLTFSLKEKHLLVILEDNGIGILESKRIRQHQNNDRRSYGISLNDSHIKIINKIHDLDITYTITDKTLVSPNITGTIVEIILPLKFKN